MGMSSAELLPQVTQNGERPRFEDDPVRRLHLYSMCCKVHKDNLAKLPDQKSKVQYISSHIDKSFFEVVTKPFRKIMGEWWSEDLVRLSALSDEVTREITGDAWESASLCVENFLEENKLVVKRDLGSAMYVNDMQEKRQVVVLDGMTVPLTSTRELSAIRYQLTLLRIMALENGASVSSADLEDTVQNAFLFSQLDRDDADGLQRLTFLVREMTAVFPLQRTCRYLLRENGDLLEKRESIQLAKLKASWNSVFSVFLETAARKELSVHPLGRAAAEGATRKVGPNMRNFADQRSQQEINRADSLLESQYAGQKQQLQKAAHTAVADYYGKFPVAQELRTVFSKHAIDTFIATLRFEISTRVRDQERLTAFDILDMTVAAESVFGFDLLQRIFGSEHTSNTPPIIRLTILFYVCMGQNGFSFGSAKPLIQAWERYVLPHLNEYKDLNPTYQEKKSDKTPIGTFRDEKYKKGYAKARHKWEEKTAQLEAQECISDEETEEFKQLFDGAISELAPTAEKLDTLIELQKANPAERKKLVAALALLTCAVGGSVYLWQLDVKNDYLLLQYRILAVITSMFLPSIYLLNAYRKQALNASYGSVRSLLDISPIQLNSLEYALEDVPRKKKKNMRQLAALSAVTLAFLLTLQLDISYPNALAAVSKQFAQGMSTATQVGGEAVSSFMSMTGELAEQLLEYLANFLPAQEMPPTEKLVNDESINVMEEPLFTTYGAHKNLMWIQETGYIEPDSSLYHPIAVEAESKLPVTVVNSVTTLRGEVLKLAKQGKLVRLNLDKNDTYYGTPHGYRPVMIIATSDAVSQTTTSEIGTKITFSSGVTGRAALVYEQELSTTTEPQFSADVPFADLIPDQEWQSGDLRWLQPLAQEARTLRKQGVSTKETLDHLKAGISKLGITYGFEPYISDAESPGEELADLFAFDTQGKPRKKQWICAQFSHALYILAREAGLDVRIANGSVQYAGDINGGYKARRHRFLLYREQPDDAYSFFEATLPSATQLPLAEPQDITSQATQEDLLMSEVRMEQNIQLVMNYLAGLGALLAVGGGALFGVRRYRKYKEEEQNAAYSHRYDQLLKKLSNISPEILDAAWRIIFACTIQSPLNSIYKHPGVGHPLKINPGKSATYAGAGYRWFDFQKGSVLPSEEEAQRIVETALGSFKEGHSSSTQEERLRGQRIDEVYNAFTAVGNEERFSRVSRRKRFAKSMVKRFWQTNVQAPLTVAQSLHIASGVITKQIEAEESLHTKMKMQEVRSIIELLLPE